MRKKHKEVQNPKVLQSQNKLTLLSDNGETHGMEKSIWQLRAEAVLHLAFVM